MNDIYVCLNVNNKVRNYAQNKDVTVRCQMIYLQINKIVMSAFQGEMAESITGFM